MPFIWRDGGATLGITSSERRNRRRMTDIHGVREKYNDNVFE